MARRNSGPGRYGLVIGLLACSALTGTAHAQAWDGSASNDWFEGANWNVNRAPQTNDSITIDTDLNTPVILDRDIDLTLSELYIGSNNRGALVVRGGAVITVNGQSGIGGGQITGTAGNGSLLVSGPGTEVLLGAQIYVGPRTNSSGTLTIENGAVLRGQSAVIGTALGTTSAVTVTGAGSLLDIGGGALYVGQVNDQVGMRDNRLSILAGGRVQGGASVSHGIGEGAVLLISGAGSELTATTSLGLNGDARIEQGGTLRYNTFSTGGDANIVIDQGNFVASAVGSAGGLTMGQTSRITGVGGTIDIGSRLGLFDDSVMTLDGTTLRADSIRMTGRSTLNFGAAEGAPSGRAIELTTPSISLESANSRIVFNHNGRQEIAASINGPGTILHRAGTTVLTSTAPTGFSGLFDHTGGTVLLNGTLSVGDFRVSGGATFGGSGTMRNGRLTMLDGVLAPGNEGVGTLTLGSLSLAPGSILNFQLGAPNLAPGTGSDYINVNTPDGTGALTLDGTLNITDAGGFGGGLYRLISYKGALTDNGLAIGSVPASFQAAGMSIQTSIAGQVNLIAAAPGIYSFWDGGGTVNDGAVAGGSGVWNATSANWTDASGAQNGAYDPTKQLIFAGTGGTVTVDNAAGQVHVVDTNQFNPLGLQFASNGYRVEGGAIDFGGHVATIRVGDGTTQGAAINATIASSLTGANSFDKTDLGTLTLTGTSTIAGRPRVQGGTLAVAEGGRLNSTGLEIALLGAPATLRVTGVGSVIDVGTGGIRTGFVNNGVGTVEVLDGGILHDAAGSGHNFGAGSIVRVSGGGSLLDLAMGSTSQGSLVVENGGRAAIAPFAFTSAGSLLLRSGGVIETRGGGSWTVPNATIQGQGTRFQSDAAIVMAPATATQPGAAVVIEDGASLIITANTDSALGFEGPLSTLDVRSGASFALTGSNGGLQMENSLLTVDGAWVYLNGGLLMGQRFGNTELVLRGGDFSADTIQGFTGSNVVSIGARAGEAAGTAGLFEVETFGFSGRGTQLVLNHTELGYQIRTDFTGDGTIRHLAGDTRFSGASEFFAGVTELSGGHLRIDSVFGNAASQMAVTGGATLSGDGRIGGSVTVGAGTIAPGGEQRNEQRALLRSAAPPSDTIGLLTIDGNLSLGADSFLLYQLGAVDGTAGIDSDLINVGGNLLLDGTVDVVDAGGFGAGVYRLINYGGSLTDNGLDIGLTPEGYAPSDLVIQTATAGQVNLLVGIPVSTFAFWDGGGAAADGSVAGGAGTWTASNGNWTLDTGTRNGAYNPDALLIFAGTAGNVTVDNAAGPVTVGSGVQFAVGGYQIAGAALRLDNSETTVRVGDGTSAGSGYLATIAAPLTGSGGLVKTDLGTLVLTGANTYSGGTFVRGGTVRGAAASLAGAFDIGALATLQIDQATDGAFAGALTGTGAVRKTGTGALALAGNQSAFAGTTTVEAGALALTGQLGGRTAIAAGASLTGNGTLSTLDVSGRVAPGTGAATLRVTGDLVFRAGSTYAVDLAAAGGTDLIEAGGGATLEGGTVAVTTLDPETGYREGSSYRILNATGGLNGRFAGLTEQSAFLDFALEYDATGASIRIAQVRVFPDVALTFNQTQAASALGALDQTAGSDGLAAYNELLMLDADAARAAFDASSGEVYATLVASAQRSTTALAQQFVTRGTAALSEGLALWGGVTGQRGHVDGDGNGARFEHDGLGGELGLDYRGAGNAWAAGIGGGWQTGELALAARGSSAELETWHLGGYVRYGTNGAGFTALASAVHASTDAQVARRIAYAALSRDARATADLGTTAVSAEVRYGFGGGAWSFGPTAGVDYAESRLGSFQESGANALDLSAAQNSDDRVRYGVGGFARLDAASGHFDLSARFVTGDSDPAEVQLDMTGSTRAFRVRAARGQADGADLQASGHYDLGGNWSLTGQVGLFASDAEQDLNGNLRLAFAF